MTGITAAVAGGSRPVIDAGSAVGTGSGQCTYSSPAVNCSASKSWSLTPTGGSGSYNYQWSLTANAGNVTLNNPTSQTCSVTRLGPAGSYGYTVQCVVTDAVYGSLVTDTVSTGAQTLTIST